MRFRRSVPHAISAARVVLALAMPWYASSPPWAVGLLALCAVTDAADGFLARRWGVASETGARLDSAADLVFFCALAVTLVLALDLVHHSASAWPLLVLLAVVAAVRGAAMVVSWHRFGVPAFIHTLGNKASGAAVIIGSALAILSGATWPLVGAGLLALVAAVEELAIMGTAGRLDLDRRGLWTA